MAEKRAAPCAECAGSEQRLAIDEKEGVRRAADDTARREDLIDAVVFLFRFRVREEKKPKDPKRMQNPTGAETRVEGSTFKRQALKPDGGILRKPQILHVFCRFSWRIPAPIAPPTHSNSVQCIFGEFF